MEAQNPVLSSKPASRPFYTRVATLGFLLIALTGLVSASISLIMVNTSLPTFSAVILVIGLLIAGALWRFGVWAQVLAALLTFLMLVAIVPFSVYILLNPEDGFDFIPLVILIFGAALGLIGSIVGLVQRGRKRLRIDVMRSERVGLRAILAALGLIVLASVILTVNARTTLSAETKANAISVGIKNFQFSPDQVQVKAGETVRLAVKNNDTTLHTFSLDAVGVNVSIPPGAERLIEFTTPAAGTYQWYCMPHSAPGPSGRTGMIGSLVVQ